MGDFLILSAVALSLVCWVVDLCRRDRRAPDVIIYMQPHQAEPEPIAAPEDDLEAWYERQEQI